MGLCQCPPTASDYGFYKWKARDHEDDCDIVFVCIVLVMKLENPVLSVAQVICLREYILLLATSKARVKLRFDTEADHPVNKLGFGSES